MHYKKLKFPSLPNYLLDECLGQIKPENKLSAFPKFDNTHVNWNERLDTPVNDISKHFGNKNTKYSYYETPNNTKKWCLENLPFKGNYDIRIHVFEKGFFVSPHIDRICRTSINLLLSDNNGITCWYEPKKEFEHLKMPEYGRNAQFLYEKLDLIEQVQFDINQWYALRTDVIHSVENVQNGCRAILKIHFSDSELFNNL